MMTAILVLVLAQPGEAASDRSAALDAMKAVTDRWAAADAGGVAGLFTEDGDVVTLSGGLLSGRAAVRDFFAESLAANQGSRFETAVDAVRRLPGDVLLVDGRWRIVPKEPGKAPAGVFTAVLVRGDERWSFAALRTSVPGKGHTRGAGRDQPF